MTHFSKDLFHCFILSILTPNFLLCTTSHHHFNRSSILNDFDQLSNFTENYCVILYSSTIDDPKFIENLHNFNEFFEKNGILFRRVFSFDRLLAENPYLSLIDVKTKKNLKNFRNFDENSKNSDEFSIIFLIPKTRPNRKCLLKSDLLHKEIHGHVFHGNLRDSEEFSQFLNENCQTYLSANGQLNSDGLLAQKLAKNLYSLERNRKSDSLSVSELAGKCGPENLRRFFYTAKCRTDDEEHEEVCYDEKCQTPNENPVLPKCDTIQAEDLLKNGGQNGFDEFFRNYVSQSKPVVIKRAVADWPAVEKWTNQFFRRNFGRTLIRAQLTTKSGEFEGVEPLELWEGHEKFVESTPKEVLEKFAFPELLLVRPAVLEMTLDQFIDLIENKTENASLLTAYMEYTHLKEYFSSLESDIKELEYAKRLQLRHLNVWYSNGNTVGKLHFDEFDNFLCQIKGRKQVILFDPTNNDQLYEGYILEGELTFDPETTEFSRTRLKPSFTITMSPVNLVQPDFRKFPRFARARPLNCTIDEGDALFMPGFWWHEVQSYPNPVEKRNLAVNFWYEPFFTKEFPCPECPFEVNFQYRHFLDKLKNF